MGYLIVGIFIVSWIIAAVVYRLNHCDALGATRASNSAPAPEVAQLHTRRDSPHSIKSVGNSRVWP